MEFKNKKYAVCISGALRGNYELSLDSIYENLVKPLNADVFIETWDSYYEWPGVCDGSFIHRVFGRDILRKTPADLKIEKNFKTKFPSTYRKLSLPIISKLDIKTFLQKYNFAHITVNKEEVFERNILSKMDTNTPAFKPNQYKMLYLMNKVNESMHAYENSQGCKYDEVIRCRPDIVFEKFDISKLINVSEKEISVNYLNYAGMDDKLFCAKSKTMDEFLNIWEKILKIHKLSPFENYKFNSHSLLGSYALLIGVNFKQLDAIFNLYDVFENFMPNLYDVFFQDLKNLFTAKDIEIDKYIEWVNMVCLEKGYNFIDKSLFTNEVQLTFDVNNKNIAFVCPTYQPRKEYAKALLDSFYDNEFDKQSDLYFVFTNEEDSNVFGEYNNKIILPKNTFDCSRKAISQGIVTTKKYYAISQIYNKYSYVICIDDDALFIKNINLNEMCARFYDEKLLIGNSTVGGNDFISRIKDLSAKAVNNIGDYSVKSDLYFWFNQPCIFKSEFVEDFFEKINFKNKMFDFKKEEFDFYMYGIYLMLYRNFMLVDACVCFPGNSGFAEGGANKNVNFLPQIVDRIYQCHKYMLKALNNPNLFMLLHLDRK